MWSSIVHGQSLLIIECIYRAPKCHCQIPKVHVHFMKSLWNSMEFILLHKILVNPSLVLEVTSKSFSSTTRAPKVHLSFMKSINFFWSPLKSLTYSLEFILHSMKSIQGVWSPSTFLGVHFYFIKSILHFMKSIQGVWSFWTILWSPFLLPKNLVSPWTY